MKGGEEVIKPAKAHSGWGVDSLIEGAESGWGGGCAWAGETEYGIEWVGGYVALVEEGERRRRGGLWDWEEFGGGRVISDL